MGRALSERIEGSKNMLNKGMSVASPILYAISVSPLTLRKDMIAFERLLDTSEE
jgi:hypothetical protein